MGSNKYLVLSFLFYSTPLASYIHTSTQTSADISNQLPTHASLFQYPLPSKNSRIWTKKNRKIEANTRYEPERTQCNESAGRWYVFSLHRICEFEFVSHLIGVVCDKWDWLWKWVRWVQRLGWWWLNMITRSSCHHLLNRVVWSKMDK